MTYWYWLLKREGYPPGVLFSLLLHGGLLLFIYYKQAQADQFVRLETPTYITASVIKENPQRVRRLEELQLLQQQQQAQQRERERQRAAEAERQKQAETERQRVAEAERQKQAEAERQKQATAERQRVAEAERQKQAEAERQQQAEAERQRVAEAERQRQAETERQRQAEQQRQQQAAAQAADEAAAVQQDLVSQYAALIHDLISRNWVIPPGARNGMMAVVEIRTTPVGDIISKNITQSSGNPAFDRSVEQAITRVGSLPELRELPNAVYERNFRVFSLIFRPEDLLR
ncbi:MAG TPA: cell envelope integrity protein TolA [Hyphomicrobiales bacterium]|nr:cell envelope integrity protein TolA [Hyphomicrobiales bacterium]